MDCGVSCRGQDGGGQCWFWKAVHCGWVLSPAGVEGEVGREIRGREDVNHSVNKQIASLLSRTVGESRVETGRGQVGCSGPRCGLFVLMLAAQMLMQAVRRAGGRAGQGTWAGQLVPWGLGLLLAAGKCSRGAWSPGAVSQSVHDQALFPNKRQPWSLGRFI